jgi:hypothetical protein
MAPPAKFERRRFHIHSQQTARLRRFARPLAI